jgi:Fur family ferric uptake transcriptional regulator
MHCTECGSVYEFTNEEVRQLRERMGALHGFRATGHRFVITGQCKACARARSPRRRLDLI